MKTPGSRLVYSSEAGRVCPACRQPAAACACSKKRAPAVTTGDGVVRVRLEVKGRRGKSVTTVTGVLLADAALRALGAELKRRCGAGGALKNGVIEIQGDHRETLVAELEGRGFRVRAS